MEMKEIDVMGMFNALNTKGQAKLSDFAINEATDYKKYQPVEDMNEVVHIFKKIFDGKKTYGTDTAKMGFFHDCVLAAKVKGNQILFALPFNGPMTKLVEVVKNTPYNRSNSILAVCEVNDDCTMLTATYYWKQFKLFQEL